MHNGHLQVMIERDIKIFLKLVKEIQNIGTNKCAYDRIDYYDAIK